MKAKISDIVKVCRSKNCSPFMFTVDLFFDNPDYYERMKKADIFTPEFIAKTYHLPLKNVYGTFYLDDCMAIKISMYKTWIVGEPDNKDTLTTQMHVPLLNMEVDI